MSLSHNEERAFLELQHRLSDVQQALRRCYITWQARMYGITVALWMGTTLMLAGMIWWPLIISGALLTLVAGSAAIIHTGPRLRIRWAPSGG
jgi:hypothetical protein